MAAAIAEVRRAEDIALVFATCKGRAEAVVVCDANPLVNSDRVRIDTLALAARPPTLHGSKAYLEADGPMPYGPDNLDLLRRAAMLRSIVQGVADQWKCVVDATQTEQQGE